MPADNHTSSKPGKTPFGAAVHAGWYNNSGVSGKFKRAVKLVSVNLLVFIALLFAANLLAGIAIDFRLNKLIKSDDRGSLPNYADKARSKLIFDEYNSLSGSGEYRPYVGWSRSEFHGVTTTINSDGDRVHQQVSPNSTAVARFFGGSTMWGTGADDDGTIPAHFDHLLPNYRVYNHGEAGFQSRQSLARLVNLAVLNEPLDLVVFYDGVNLVQYYCSSRGSLNSHGRANFIADRVERSRLESMFIGNLIDVAFKLGPKLRGLLPWGNRDSGSLCERDSAYAQEVASALVESWKVAHTIVTSKGGRFVAILQPVFYLGNPRRDHLDLSLNSRIARSYHAVYPLIQKLIAESQDDWMLDFTDAFDGSEAIYIDFNHVSENGNRIIAQKLARALASP